MVNYWTLSVKLYKILSVLHNKITKLIMLFYYETNVTGFNKKEKSLIEKNKKKKESQTTLLDPSTSSRNNSK